MHLTYGVPINNTWNTGKYYTGVSMVEVTWKAGKCFLLQAKHTQFLQLFYTWQLTSKLTSLILLPASILAGKCSKVNTYKQHSAPVVN